MITNEIEMLHSKAHNLSLIDSQRRLNENNKLLQAMQCIQMQELVKETIDRKVDPDDSALLYKSDVAIFVENLNKIIRKSFEVDKNVSVQIKETEIKPITFTDMMQPIFSDCGQILGFELRKEFVTMIYQNNDFDPKEIKKVIRHCLYINRMMTDGLQNDFFLKKAGTGPTKEHKEMQTEPPSDGTPADQCLDIMKSHLIDLMTRMNPTKKGYYTIVME